MNKLSELVRKNRSYRRFSHDEKISDETLMELIDLTRYTASARNAQPLRYRIVNEENMCNEVFCSLKWAGYLKEWDGPEERERPSAYIVVLKDNDVNGLCEVDAGICMQTILLGATEAGYGGCMIGAFNKKRLTEMLCIPERYEIIYVIALGKPVEDVRIAEVEQGDIRYYRDQDGIHYVPKRSIRDIII